MAKATNTQATNETTQATTTNPFLAVFASETAKIEQAAQNSIKKQLDKVKANTKLLAEAACANLGVELSEGANDFYSLLVSSASTDSIAAASGAQLAESVITMLTAYYAGNKDAVAPIVDAANIWIASKAEGDCKTANLPNNLRLLVSRKSVEIAVGEDEQNPAYDYKLILSTEGKKGEKRIVIKEDALKAAPKRTKAQKVFAAITGLETLDRDELIGLIATDAQLTSLFSTLSAVNQSKAEEVTRDTVAQLEARRNHACQIEDDLADKLEAATESKLQLADDLADKRDELAENETKLTAKREERLSVEAKLKRARKDEVKTQLAEDLEVIDGQMSDLLADNEAITKEVNELEAKLEKALKVLNNADNAYNSQAHLTAQIGSQLEKCRAQLVH